MRRYPNANPWSAKHGAPAYFERTGEFRPPRKGEYYLSGAIPEAWQTPNDLSTPYHILKPGPTPERQIVVDGFIYRLEGWRS